MHAIAYMPLRQAMTAGVSERIKSKPLPIIRVNSCNPCILIFNPCLITLSNKDWRGAIAVVKPYGSINLDFGFWNFDAFRLLA